MGEMGNAETSSSDGGWDLENCNEALEPDCLADKGGAGL